MQLAPLSTTSPITGATRSITSSLLNEAYLTPQHAGFNLRLFIGDPKFPWYKSYLQDPAGVEIAISAALTDLMHAAPELNANKINISALPDGRAKTHLKSLKVLWQKIDALPEDLATIRHILTSTKDDALESLPMTRAAACPFATPAQASLYATLASHHGTLLEPITPPRADGLLKHIQENLLNDAQPNSKFDTTNSNVSIFGLRDPFEEANFVVGRIQKLCGEGSVWEDFGVLTPDDPIYHAALQSAFERAGIVLSGETGTIKRDHKGEFLTLALSCLKSHNSNMARASLCLSPLMPWSHEDGRRLANAIMFGGVKNALADIEHAKTVFNLLRMVENQKSLFVRLDLLAKLTIVGAEFAPNIGALRASQTTDDLNWVALERAASPRPTSEQVSHKSMQGVSLFSENALPWRPVKELIVLGMTGPNWPRPARANPFFTESEFDLIEKKTGLALASRKRALARGLELFRQQLSAAHERLTLCAPARDLTGKKQSASVALTLVAKAMGELKSPLSLIANPSDADALSQNIHADTELLSPGVPASGLLGLGGNLLTLRHEDGTNIMKPQSVSRLETMLVSPLAWALGEIGAEEMLWSPQGLDAMLLGTIIHDILEHGFLPNTELLDDVEISVAMPEYFSAALMRCAPWLEEDAWVLEHKNLFLEAKKSTLAWAQFLRSTGAKVIGNEKHLQGLSPKLFIRTHGYADCILELPDKRILVVDHKRSKSANRVKRLEAKSDLQVTLYKEMLLNPQGDDALDLRRTGPDNIIAAYHTTMDQSVIVSHATEHIPDTISVPGDISSVAMELLGSRIKDLTVGKIRLNRASDAQNFEKGLAIKPYALEGNRLVQAFMISDQEAAQ